jgi:uncharacterized protein YecE (DUF72 family)
VTPGKLYFRLHGRSGWRYEYEESELQELAAMLPNGTAKSKTPYVFFNNVRMTEDALRFQTLGVRGQRSGVRGQGSEVRGQKSEVRDQT